MTDETMKNNGVFHDQFTEVNTKKSGKHCRSEGDEGWNGTERSNGLRVGVKK